MKNLKDISIFSFYFFVAEYHTVIQRIKVGRFWDHARIKPINWQSFSFFFLKENKEKLRNRATGKYISSLYEPLHGGVIWHMSDR